MVMDNLPVSDFPAIDVRDALLDGDLLSGKLNLRLLDTQFVGHIPGELNNLITQFNLPL